MIFLWLGCLNSAHVKQLKVPSQEGVISLCPGQDYGLRVNAKMRNGKRKNTQGSGRDKLPWKKLEVRLDGQPIQDGVLRMPQDPTLTWRRPLELKVWLGERPEVMWTGQVVARYDCSYYADLRGYNGGDGQSRQRVLSDDGEDGAEREGRRGGRGRDGRDGQDGAHGGHGAVGGSAQVTLQAGEGERAGLLEARVQGARGAESVDWLYLLDPGSGSLTVDASGGVGGAGESGADGGDGGDGGDGSPRGAGGDGGAGGEGGNGGDGGQGGELSLTVDPSAQDWSGRVELVVVGGPGGQGGAGGQGGEGGSGEPEGGDGPAGRAGQSGKTGPKGERGAVRVQALDPAM